jgi:hypothetical protein
MNKNKKFIVLGECGPSSVLQNRFDLVITLDIGDYVLSYMACREYGITNRYPE